MMADLSTRSLTKKKTATIIMLDESEIVIYPRVCKVELLGYIFKT